MTTEGGAVIAAVVGVFGLTYGAGIVLVPDVELYLSGLSMYPSLGGTALGSLVGFGGLCLLHSFAVGLLVIALYWSRPSWPALFLSLPVLLWVVPLGMDTLAVLGITAGLVAGLRWAPWAAAFVHAAALPVAVALVASRSRRGLLAVPVAGAAAVCVLAVSPYGSDLLGRSGSLAPALAVGLLVTLLGLAPVAVAGVAGDARRTVAAVAGSTFLVATFAAAADFARPTEPGFGLVLFAATRYALPLTMTALVLGAGRQTERPTTAPGKGATMRRLKAFGVSLVVTSFASLLLAGAAFAQTVPAVPVSQYGDSLLTSLASAIGQIFPYAAAITAFAIGVGMVKRWLGHRKATRV